MDILIPLFVIGWVCAGIVILTLKVGGGFTFKPHTLHGQAIAALVIVIFWPAWFIKISQGD